MRQLRILLLLTMALALGTTGVLMSLQSAGRAQALTDCTPPADVNAAVEAQFLDLMNTARAEAGAGPLKISPNLQRAALWKSADSSALGSGFSHTDSLGRDTVTSGRNRAIECGYATWAAENVGYGAASAEAMFDLFMNSPGHRANILDARMVVAGVGLVYHGATPAWTIDFGTIDDSTTGTSPTTPAGGTATPPPATNTPTPPAMNTVTATTTIPATTTPDTPTATPTSSPTATPTGTPHPAHSVQLAAGINLVTFEGPTMAVSTAVGGLGDELTAVYAWHADSQTWSAYFPGAPGYANRLALLTPGEAYYLIMRSGMTWGY